MTDAERELMMRIALVVLESGTLDADQAEQIARLMEGVARDTELARIADGMTDE